MKRIMLIWSARETGVNAALLSATNDSNRIPINGANFIELDFSHANTSGALTITMAILTQRLTQEIGGTLSTSKKEVTRAIAAGVETLSARTLEFVVAGADAWSYKTDIDGDILIIEDITAAGAAATDLLSMQARVSNKGA